MLKEYTSKYVNRPVGFVGVGISNIPIIQAFCRSGALATVRDMKDKDKIYGIEQLEGLDIRYLTGKDYLKDINEELLFLAPAVRPDKEELLCAQEKGTVLTTELNEFLSLCPCKTYGITGSDGKTTTTTLIAKLLEASGKKVWLGGNIGKNLFKCLDEISPDDCVVMECSSFQLMKMKHSPDVAVLTNLSPNHLDWHKDMDEYFDSKKNIYRFNENTKIIANIDNEYTASIADEREIVPVSCKERIEKGVCFDGEYIYRNGEKIIRGEDILIPGIHNRYNYCTAIAATADEVDAKAIKRVATTFGGVEHRCELVRTVNGVKYYNSSIDSSPTRTAAACNAFKEKVIVIAGGYDKNIPLEPLGELFTRKVKGCVLMGATADKIQNVLDDCGYEGTIMRATDMKQAVDMAKSIAQDGDNVILSPAAASFDMFRNFEERGNIFKSCVMEL